MKNKWEELKEGPEDIRLLMYGCDTIFQFTSRLLSRVRDLAPMDAFQIVSFMAIVRREMIKTNNDYNWDATLDWIEDLEGMSILEKSRKEQQEWVEEIREGFAGLHL